MGNNLDKLIRGELEDKGFSLDVTRCTNVHAMVRFFLNKGVTEDEIFKGTDKSVTPDYISDGDNWISYQNLVILMKNCQDSVPDTTIYDWYQAGREIALYQQTKKYRLAGRLKGIQFLYQKTVQLTEQNAKYSKASINEIRNGFCDVSFKFLEKYNQFGLGHAAYWYAGVLSAIPNARHKPLSKSKVQYHQMLLKNLVEFLYEKQNFTYEEDEDLIRIDGEIKAKRIELKKDEKSGLFIPDYESDSEDYNAVLVISDIEKNGKIFVEEGEIFNAPYCRITFRWKPEFLVRSPLYYFRRAAIKRDVIGELEDQMAKADERYFAQKRARESEKIQRIRAVKAEEEVRKYANHLEDLVDERTKELSVANRELKKAYHDLQAMQTELIQQGTLASAGRLAIGVAHNIRNPIEAVRRNLDQLKKKSKEVLFLYMQEITREQGFSPDELHILQGLIEKKYFENEGIELLDTREVFDNAEELEILVKNNDIDLSSKQIRKIAEYNITKDEFSTLIPYLKNYRPEDMVQILTAGYKLGVYTSMSIDSIIIANDIINATMSYAGINEKKVETDINTHIEDILMLMRGSIRKNNITVKRDFDRSLPRIEINQAILNQVYENLFSNAIYAMRDAEGERTLSVRTYQEENRICFDVADTGHGIPDESKGKIFQPFFTTKPEGEGTGTGLWTVYYTISRIGEIDVVSRPGYTRFTVKIDKDKIK